MVVCQLMEDVAESTSQQRLLRCIWARARKYARGSLSRLADYIAHAPLHTSLTAINGVYYVAND